MAITMTKEQYKTTVKLLGTGIDELIYAFEDLGFTKTDFYKQNVKPLVKLVEGKYDSKGYAKAIKTCHDLNTNGDSIINIENDFIDSRVIPTLAIFNKIFQLSDGHLKVTVPAPEENKEFASAMKEWVEVMPEVLKKYVSIPEIPEIEDDVKNYTGLLQDWNIDLMTIKPKFDGIDFVDIDQLLSQFESEKAEKKRLKKEKADRKKKAKDIADEMVH